jgi:hypothetical protein
MVHEHGLGSSRYSLTINLGDSDRAEVSENPENHILFEELRSGRRLLRTRHLGRVTEWLDALGHSESEVNDLLYYMIFMHSLMTIIRFHNHEMIC